MRSFTRLLRKECAEIVRTWRLPTVGGVLLFFAVMSPLAALATPALLSSVTASQPGVVIKLPDPTYLDSYAQWVKNLSQMGLLLIVFSSAGLIAGERTSGTAILVVTKPVSRSGFVVAKFVAQAALVAATALVGSVVTFIGTLVAFGEAPAGVLAVATAVWLVGAFLAIAVTELFSALMPTLAAGVSAMVVVGLSSTAALWEPAARFSPAGITGAVSDVLAGKHVALGWPLVTSAILTVVLVALAGWAFGRRVLSA